MLDSICVCILQSTLVIALHSGHARARRLVSVINNIDLFTDTAAILIPIVSKDIAGCPRGKLIDADDANRDKQS